MYWVPLRESGRDWGLRTRLQVLQAFEGHLLRLSERAGLSPEVVVLQVASKSWFWVVPERPSYDSPWEGMLHGPYRSRLKALQGYLAKDAAQRLQGHRP